MRMALAVIFQLTNTFSLESPGIDSFIEFNTDRGNNLPACDPYGVERLVESILSAASDRNMTVDVATNLVARSAGPIKPECLVALENSLAESLAEKSAPPDVLVLVLSGAMTNDDRTSADLMLIKSARNAVGADTPIVAIFSQWANLDDDIVRAVDLVIGVDLDDAGSTERVSSEVVLRSQALADHTIRPTHELRKLRILTPVGSPTAAQMLSTASALARVFARQEGVLDATVYAGFPFADVAHAGVSVVVTTDGDPDSAASLAERLQRSIWDQREAFVWSPPNVEIAVHDAMLSESAPVTIADVGDDPTFGAAGDGTGLLWALIDLGAQNAALGVIVDAAAVADAVQSGVGSELKFDVGGTVDRRAGYPINVTARVRRIADGCVASADRCVQNVGRAVLLDVQGRHGGRDRRDRHRTPACLSRNRVVLCARRGPYQQEDHRSQAHHESARRADRVR